MIALADLVHLRRCVELAREALDAGDYPFGSVLVDKSGTILKEDRNRQVTGANVTLHPEFTLALWAQQNLEPSERASTILYTSGEHCPMCAATHAYAGLGRIVYASSSAQLAQWKNEFGSAAGPVQAIPINGVAPGIIVDGPVESLAAEVRELHRSMLSPGSCAS